MLVSEVASTRVTLALAVRGGTVPVAARRCSRLTAGLRPTGPMARRPSIRPEADTKATVTWAALLAVPPSQAESR